MSRIRSLSFFPILFLLACSLSGSDATVPAQGGVSAEATRTDCPDFSGEFTTHDEDGRLIERTITQSGCDELRIQDAIHLNINGKETIAKSDDLYIADQVCRTYTESDSTTQACTASWFTRTAWVTEIVNKVTPGVNHEFRSGLFTTTIGAEGVLTEVFEFLGPNGALLKRESRVWQPVSTSSEE